MPKRSDNLTVSKQLSASICTYHIGSVPVQKSVWALPCVEAKSQTLASLQYDDPEEICKCREKAEWGDQLSQNDAKQLWFSVGRI